MTWRHAGIVLTLALVLGAQPASATFPGANGRIAYTEVESEDGFCGTCGTSYAYELFTVTPSGGDRRPASPAVDDFFDPQGATVGYRDPAFSPDGRMLAMTYDREDRRARIQLASAGSTQPADLNAGASPFWSASGGRVAFQCLRGVCSVRVDGRDRDVLPWPDGGFGHRWSPTGRKVAFEAFVDRGRRTQRTQIFVMTRRGTRMRQLTRGAFAAFDPDWSPDGRRIAFSREGDIHVKRIGGGPPRRLTRERGCESSPVWSPDGRSIAFLRGRREERRFEACGAAQIHLMRRDGSERRRILGAPRERSLDGPLSWQSLR